MIIGDQVVLKEYFVNTGINELTIDDPTVVGTVTDVLPHTGKVEVKFANAIPNARDPYVSIVCLNDELYNLDAMPANIKKFRRILA